MASVEVCVIAAEDLKEVSILGKMSPYAVAWVDVFSKQRTAAAKKGGSSPVWSDPEKSTMQLQLSLANPYACLTLQLRAKCGPRGDALIGTAWLPLHEIARLCAIEGSEDEQRHHVSLALQRPSGRMQGVIRLSIRLLGAAAAHLPRIARPVVDDHGTGIGSTAGGYHGTYHGNRSTYHSTGATAKYHGNLEPVEGIPVYYNVPPPPPPPTGGYHIFPPPSAPPMPVVPPRGQAGGGNGLLLGILGGLLGAIILGDIIL